MVDVNQKFYDFLLKRQHYVYYYENGLIKELIEPFKLARADIITAINKLQDTGTGFTLQYRLDRLNAQLNEINFVLNNATDTAIGNLSASLNEFAKLEADTYFDMLQSRFNTIGIGLERLPIEQVYQMVSTPLGGVQYADRMRKNYGDLVFDMRAQLTQSILQGEDMAQAARRLYKNTALEWGTKSKIIARTEIQRVSNNVSYGVYKENTDVLKGVEYVATLDDRTCIACGALDGRIYYFEKGDDPVGSDRPPLHPYCRCTLSPITYSWVELGDKAAQDVPPSTRASFSGQVPATEKYPDWLRRMDKENPAFVKGILGTGRKGQIGRYQLWQSGKIDFKKMAEGNRVLNLQQLDNLVKRKK